MNTSATGTHNAAVKIFFAFNINKTVRTEGTRPEQKTTRGRETLQNYGARHLAPTNFVQKI